MKIVVVGTGYVGLVSGVCFAEMGNTVVCVEKDKAKIDLLKKAQSPIYEPGLTEILARNIRDERISFTSSLEDAMDQAEIVFIAVGTPQGEDGSADVKYVMTAAREIARHLEEGQLIVTKSTVPVGTNGLIKEAISKELKKLKKKTSFEVASNPEFLKEGAAINDFMKPDRIVIGTDSARALFLLQKLYDPFVKNGRPLLNMDIPSAEMTKYAANAMLATKISFMNELSRLCEKTGADIQKVRTGIASDPRIGPHFIYAGLGYGGSCFPKDVQALMRMGKDQKSRMGILEAVDSANAEQRTFFLNKIFAHFGKKLSGKKIAVWGLAFKPDTDDLREAPALDIIRGLLKAGAQVAAFDPVAMEHARKILPEKKGLKYGEDQYSVLADADAVCLVTEWKQFREPNWKRMRAMMKKCVVFDGRNIYESKFLDDVKYFGIGRS